MFLSFFWLVFLLFTINRFFLFDFLFWFLNPYFCLFSFKLSWPEKSVFWLEWVENFNFVLERHFVSNTFRKTIFLNLIYRWWLLVQLLNWIECCERRNQEKGRKRKRNKETQKYTENCTDQFEFWRLEL